MIGWLANALILFGMFRLGDKWRHAFLFSIAGEAMWSYVAYTRSEYDLMVICVVFCGMAFRNWLKWGSQ